MVNNSDGQCGAIVTYGAVHTADCIASTFGSDHAIGSGNFFSVGVHDELYIVSNAEGVNASCSFLVVVNDTEAPSITCPSNLAMSNDPGMCSAVLRYTQPVGWDNCAGRMNATMVSGLGLGGVLNVSESVTDTYVVHDANGLQAQCSVTVTVADTEAPVFHSCSGDMRVPMDSGKCYATINYGPLTATDNCGNPTVTLLEGQASGTRFSAGATLVNYSAVDSSGNTAICSFTVTVYDDQSPLITCQSSASYGTTEGVCERAVNYIVDHSDNCASNLSQTSGPASGSSLSPGSYDVAFVTTDTSGRSASCSFVVNVTDMEPPVITCPVVSASNNAPDSCSAVVTFGAPSVWDNCGATVSQTSQHGSGYAFPVGSTTVSFRAVDNAGLSGNCSVAVVVNDNQPPTIVCPTDVSTVNDWRQCGANVSLSAPQISDNCGTPSFSVISGNNWSPSFYTVGMTTNTYKVTDGSGNQAQCTMHVTVRDTETPTITCPLGVTLNNSQSYCYRNYSYSAPTIADNCAGTTLTLTSGYASGSSFPVGNTTVSYTVTDTSSMSASCSFQVIVNDIDPPAIACPAAIQTSTDPGVCYTNLSFALPRVQASCADLVKLSLLAGQMPGTLFQKGITNETFSATDPSGKNASCSFKVTVQDLEPPVVVCPNDTVVSTSAS